MRIGVVSNFYPPVIYGGYEIGCGQVVEGLRARGMDVEVLTSAGGGADGPGHVHRWLDSSMDCDLARMPAHKKLAYVMSHERQNLRALRRFVRQTSPDILYLWNLGFTSHALLAASLASALPTGCFAFDYGLAEQDADVWINQTRSVSSHPLRTAQIRLLGMAGKLIGRPAAAVRPLDFIHYPTRHLRDFLARADYQPSEWVAVSWGVEMDRFYPAALPLKRRMLYVGQVAEHKGVHLAIEALAALRQVTPGVDFGLTIAGRCMDAVYETRLRHMVDQHGLGGVVQFIGFVKREDLSDLYREHAVLIFPSLWEEPMGITILEAMASGLAVVISGTGGSAELIEEGKNGMVFRSGDANDLTRKLAGLLTTTHQLEAIGRAARETAKAKYDFQKTLDTIEGDLIKRSRMRAGS